MIVRDVTLGDVTMFAARLPMRGATGAVRGRYVPSTLSPLYI